MNFGLIQEVEPILRAGVSCRAAVELQETEMKMIQLGENFRHLVSLRHIPGDFLTAGAIVHVTIGIDDLHKMSTP